MLYRLWVFTVLSICSVLFLTNITAQTPGQPYRLQDKDVEKIIRRIELRRDQFRANLDSALDKRRYNNTRIDHVNTFIEIFHERVKRLHDQFDKRLSSTSDVRVVLDCAAPIDDFMTRNRLSSEAQKDWTRLRNKLDQLALAYNIEWRWDTYRSNDSTH